MQHLEKHIVCAMCIMSIGMHAYECMFARYAVLFCMYLKTSTAERPLKIKCRLWIETSRWWRKQKRERKKKPNARTVKVTERRRREKKKYGRVLIYGCTWIDIERRRGSSSGRDERNIYKKKNKIASTKCAEPRKYAACMHANCHHCVWGEEKMIINKIKRRAHSVQHKIRSATRRKVAALNSHFVSHSETARRKEEEKKTCSHENTNIFFGADHFDLKPECISIFIFFFETILLTARLCVCAHFGIE